jgi:hypothetical protein
MVFSAQLWIHHGLQHFPETGNCFWTGFAIGSSHAISLCIRELAFEGFSLIGQMQVSLTLVRSADVAFDQAILDQRPKYPVQRLFGNAKNTQKVIDRRSRTPGNEMERPVMRSTVGKSGKDAIRISGEPAIGKKHCLNALTQLFVG